MEVQHRISGARGMFYVENDDEIQAELIYTVPEEGRIIIEHTEVGEELKGQNVGYSLVNAAVEYARQHHFRITAICPFARSVFDKKPDFQDVLSV